MNKNNSLCVKKTVSLEVELWAFVQSQSRGNYSQIVREAILLLRDQVEEASKSAQTAGEVNLQKSKAAKIKAGEK